MLDKSYNLQTNSVKGVLERERESKILIRHITLKMNLFYSKSNFCFFTVYICVDLICKKKINIYLFSPSQQTSLNPLTRRIRYRMG